MDLNYLLAREQEALALADRTSDARARDAHLELARRYRGLIEAYSRDLAATPLTAMVERRPSPA